jgi:hypothetical protein
VRNKPILSSEKALRYDSDLKGSVAKIFLVVSLKKVGAKTNWTGNKTTATKLTVTLNLAGYDNELVLRQ